MGDSVLDFCCGSGDVAFLVSEKVEVNGKVIGLDFAKDQLAVASLRQKLKTKACYMNIEILNKYTSSSNPYKSYQRTPIIKHVLQLHVELAGLKVMHLHDLPFSNGQFDAITMGYGLQNVVDKHKAMQEMFRVLKAGSRVSILDFNKSAYPVTALQPSLQEMMIDNVLVPVASGFGLEEDYKYLKRSIREFLTGEELEKLALDVGFSDARYYEIGGGLMGNLVATH